VTRLLRRIALLCAFALLAPAAALAQAPATEIDGSPLNVWTDENARVQVGLDGAPGEFYPPGSDGNPTTFTNAGFGIVLFDINGTHQGYGPLGIGAYPAPNSGPTLTPGNPAKITTTWMLDGPQAKPAAKLTQELAYTNGSRQVEATYTVQNLVAGAPLGFRALWAGDLAIRGSDVGVAFMQGSAPTRFMGGLNQQVGAAGGFVEETPWSAFESNALGEVGSRARAVTENPGFDGSLSPVLQDNAAGVEWDDHYPPNGLPGGATATYKVALKFIDTLGISPLGATEQTGNEHVTKVTLNDLQGRPIPNQRLGWSSSGVNPGSGSMTTDKNGHAQFSYIGGQEGDDQLAVFIDTNNDGIPDPNSAQASTTVHWTGNGLAPPQIGSTVNVRPEQGTVRVQLAAGTSKARAKALGIAPAARKRFVRLRAGLQIPIGSLLDTTRGTVRLLSAGVPVRNNSAFQAASFRGSQFEVKQSFRNPLTELVAKGGGLNGCRSKLPRGGARKIAAARRRGRSLFGSGKGRFRTRGRNSSATVRGTTWLQKDTCTTTTTLVKAGTVVVRDFTKHKTIVLKKGRRYVAHAPRR
jgi:hypothetical protein